jgi:hypothetical protein
MLCWSAHPTRRHVGYCKPSSFRPGHGAALAGCRWSSSWLLLILAVLLGDGHHYITARNCELRRQQLIPMGAHDGPARSRMHEKPLSESAKPSRWDGDGPGHQYRNVTRSAALVRDVIAESRSSKAPCFSEQLADLRTPGNLAGGGAVDHRPARTQVTTAPRLLAEPP